MRPSDVLLRATRYLDAHGVQSPRETAEQLLAEVLMTDRAGLYARTEGLDSAEARSFGRALCRRCAGEPVQHLTGRQQFRHLDLEVRPGVFIPRQETEVLVDVALEALANVAEPVAVDVGTGTGAVALSLKAERPDSVVYATDLSPDAAQLTRANAERHRLEVTVLVGDLLTPLPGDLAGRMDLVVSNPPYVRPEEYDDLPDEVKADPELALFGGTAIHRRLAQESPKWLRPGGMLAMEIGADQAGEVIALLEPGFTGLEVRPDLAGRDRVVLGRRQP
jgi:release factor glutamine methyltransferase